MLKCQLCEEKFLRKSDLFIHLKQHGVRVLACSQCDDRFLEASELRRHQATVHGAPAKEQTSPATGQKRRPGPASRTNAPREQRAVPSNLPGHLAAQCPDTPGFPCQQCGKVLMHKQSYVSHMRVIHGDYYGGNKWKGSSVVEMVLGGGQHREGQANNNTESPRDYSDYKFGQNSCEFCSKAFSDPFQLEEHITSKHPNLTRRIQAFKAALGLKDSEQEPDTKRFKLDYKGIFKDQNENSLSSYSVLSFSHAPDAHLSSSGYSDEPLDLACKPVSVDVDERSESERGHALHDSNNNHHHGGQHLSNNLLQLARPPPVSPPCSPLNLHVPRPATPSPSPSPPDTPRPSQPSQPSLLALVQPSSLLMPVPSHPLPPPPGPEEDEELQNTLGAGHTDPNQPKLHEYLVKQSNATSDENGRKKFLCPVCKCQLSWKTNLSVHLRTHSGERPFSCVLCFNRFRQKAHLYKHFRCSHGHKVAPYQCMFCTESFMRSPNDLYNHITEVHKRETDELSNNNNNSENNNNNIKFESEEDIILQEKAISLQEMQENKFLLEEKKQAVILEEKREEIKIIQESNIDVENLDEEDEVDVDNKDVEEEEEDDISVKDREDNVRYEAIEDEFDFSGEKIKPCYCVLPFVSDDEVEGMTKRNIAVSSSQ
jgi:hypothetical protein